MENDNDFISVTVSGSREGVTKFIEDLIAGQMLPPILDDAGDSSLVKRQGE